MTRDHAEEIANIELSRLQREIMLAMQPTIIRMENIERMGIKRDVRLFDKLASA